MKIGKYVTYSALLLLSWITFAQLELPGNPSIYNEDQKQYIQAEEINNPIRDGAYGAINNNKVEGGKIEGLASSEEKIEAHVTAKNKTLNLIKNFINYALGLISLIALIYLIAHGVMMVTAAGDDAQYKKGIKGIKFATIALIGVGFSWIIVSSIFWIINNVLLTTR